MKHTYINEEYSKKMSEIKEMPLFSSYHQAHLDGKTLKEWLYSQPLQLLHEYGNAELFPEDEDDTENQKPTEDILGTALLLKAAVTNNEPLEEKEVVKETKMLQILLATVALNKEVQIRWNDEDIEAVILKNCTWETYEDMIFQPNPNIKVRTEGDEVVVSRKK